MNGYTEELFSKRISPAEFNRIRSLIYEHTAIVVPEDRKYFVRSRILKRMRQIRVESLSHYCDLVENGDEPISEFTSQVTTNHTYFFRERHHFETLVKHLRSTGCENKLVWSSACSSGEEPYSIALAIREAFPDRYGDSLRIIASDLDEQILTFAERGVYDEKCVSRLSIEQKTLGFMRGKNHMSGTVRVKDWMRAVIEFKKINLMKSLDVGRDVDVIFCRNVAIYFNHESKIRLFRKFADIQKPGDLLLIGHSESLIGISNAYQCLGATVYKRL